jgi:glyoxylase-like metal-dependent hydrolase (beta-lactamase superfamily II)
MIRIIDLRFKTQEAIAAFLVETTAGPVLIETGPYSVFEHLVKGLARYGYEPSDIEHVLLTHIHFDHAGAAWALAREGATVHVHPKGYQHLHEPSRLYESARRIYGDQMEKLWGEMRSIPADQLVAVEDEAEIQIGEMTFKAWHTPGHASHHIAWQLGDSIFTGDVAGVKIGQGPVMPPCPPPDIDLEAWQTSIALLRGLSPKRLYLTHFGEITAVTEHLRSLSQTLKAWGEWIKPYFDRKKKAEKIIPKFEAFVEADLRKAGLDDEGVAQYEAANPAFMSVAGLLRYWKKRTS